MLKIFRKSEGEYKKKAFDKTCTSCESRVERAVKKLDGVKNAMVIFSCGMPGYNMGGATDTPKTI